MAGAASNPAAITHRRIWRLAGPIILANVMVPLLGAVDTAVVGHLPEPYFLGAVAVGAMIFHFLYWAFAFLRMGTTGFAAQARGAEDDHEMRATLARAVLSAIAVGALAILFQGVIADASLWLIEASEAVESHAHTYITIRIWGAPAALANFAFLGWFIGIQNPRAALTLQIVTNGVNITLDLLFVVGFGWDVAGVASATVIAEVAGVCCGTWLARDKLRHIGGRFLAAHIFHGPRLRRLFAVNMNIFLRNILFNFAMLFFIAQGAKAGDVVLAANAVLMNFIFFLAYGLDGFAFTAEALVGNAIGGRDRGALRHVVVLTTFWAFLCAIGYTAVYAVSGGFLVRLLTDLPDVRAVAMAHFGWVIAAPLLSVWTFQLDGIFVGATRTRDMRNGAIVATAAFLLAAYTLPRFLANDGLWLALALMWLVRAATLAVRYPAVERMVRQD